MSNTIQTELPTALALIAAIALAGCSPGVASEGASGDGPHAVASAGAAPATTIATVAVAATTPATVVRPSPVTVDPDPEPATASQVVERRDIEVFGKPACAFTVRYAGALDQPVTWRGEKCADLAIAFVNLAELKAMGQFARLTAEALDDLPRLPDRRALYIEGQFSSALYPANSMQRIYEVELAD